MNSKSGLWAALLLLVPLWQVGALGTTILSIGDGDTIRVLHVGKALTVRLACIDAPVTWTLKTEPALMRASLPARIGQEKLHESQTPQPRADHPQVADR